MATLNVEKSKLSAAMAEYLRRTPRSATEHERACAYLPGGVGSPLQYKRPYPLVIAEGRGSRVWDVDGNEYIDYLLASGTAVAGHGNPVIAEAIARQARRGTVFSMPTPLAAELAEELRRRYPVLDLVRFTQSGTEATMYAVRVARAATGRRKIVKIEGSYHGHADPLLVSIGDAPLSALGEPTSPVSTLDSRGLLPAIAQHVVVVEYNDLSGMSAAFERHPNEIAAVVIEPVMSSAGVIPPSEGYLEGVRELTSRHGALLVFDEVQVGCRVSPGGAPELYGVTPDLIALGKVISGGTPLAAFGGRRDLMETVAPLGRTGHSGTYCANPLSLAAGLACLRQVVTDEAWLEMERLARLLADGQRQIVETYGIPATVSQVGTIGSLLFTPRAPATFREAAQSDQAKWLEFWFEMLNRGVIPTGSAWFKIWALSTAHTEDDVEQTLSATEEALVAVYGA